MVEKAAALGFERGAADYERARPSYPVELIERLAVELPIRPRTRLCDLAAGTGKLTRSLLSTGADLVAVEPISAMRNQLRIACPDVEVLDGTAEAIPLPDASVDVVTVAQAFHWFEISAALAEIRRVLRPGGGLALIWNARDESVAWVAAWTEIVHGAVDGLPYHDYKSRDWPALVAGGGGFTELRSARYPNPQPATPDTVLGRTASTSYVSALPDRERTLVLARVEHLLGTHHDLVGRDRFEIPHDTVAYWCHRI